MATNGTSALAADGVFDDAELREHVRSRRDEVIAGAERRLDAHQSGRAIVKFISKGVDELLVDLWRAVSGPVANAVDIVAVGGYGRAELCPHSDWDLLFLVPNARDEAINAAIQRYAQLVWDSGAHLGHAVRTPAEARAFAQTDHHGRTALLESRLLSGSGKLYDRLQSRASQERWSKRQRVEFCRTKLEECAERRTAQGGTAFVMEPDVKSGKGGLRDVSTIFWLSMAWYGVPTARQLIGDGVVDEDEFNAFVRGRDFLWRVRTGLHLMAGREHDRLRFEYQAELAQRFRYRDSKKSSAVERFLKNYFLNVRAIADLSDIFLLHFQEQVNPPRKGFRRKALGGGMGVRNEKLAIYDPEAFAADPLNVIRVFREAQKDHRYLNSKALRTIRKHASLMSASVRASREANKIFLEILRSPRNVTTALSQMHETGVLGRFCPDFGRITGHGQFDRYHHYTVDAHTIRGIDILRDFALDEREFIDLPLAAELMPKLRRPELLYIALLYHDIAKGRGGDHSEIGETLARRFCKRLGLSQDDIDLVAWLVLYHLRLSMTAQHYDLDDPEVIAEFARFVGDRERLVYLFLLTVADVTAVGPGTWNDWKRHLFTRLYHQTDACLRTGQVEPEDMLERMEARKGSVLKLASRGERDRIGMALGIVPSSMALHFPPDQLLETARMLTREYGVAISQSATNGHTEVHAWGLDRPALFADLTATLAHANTKVMAANAYGLRDGRVLDEFYITDGNDKPVTESGQVERLEKRLLRVLEGEKPKPVKRPANPDILMKKQRVQVRQHTAAAHHVTAIEVVAADRRGLIADLAAAIATTGVNLHGASIATFGEKAVDVFFVTDVAGRPVDQERIDALIAALTAAAELPD
ncbi:MAG: [protein-PII] uridylyltransferase [Gammaproteobacteria bacterium]